MNNQIPYHIAIILDGNRRWAKSRGLTSLEGHKRGFENVKKIAKYAFSQGVKVLTVYAFSTENWKRDKEEVAYLMNLFRLLLTKEIKQLKKDGVKINFFGRLDDFDDNLKKLMVRARQDTAENNKGLLNICLSYGGRDELVRAFKKIVDQKIATQDINEELISDNLDSAGVSDPDLIIRTSGELRLSGFLTWQSVYSELYFPKVHWPDFDTKEFDKAISEFQHRQRRFGGN